MNESIPNYFLNYNKYNRIKRPGKTLNIQELRRNIAVQIKINIPSIIFISKLYFLSRKRIHHVGYMKVYGSG